MKNSVSHEQTRPVFRKQKSEMVFKIFYNPNTGRCSHKTTGEDIEDLPYIIVDYKTYNDIEICNKYRVINGQLEQIKTGTIYKKLSKSDTGKFKTIKNNMIFVVDDNFRGEIDNWSYNANDI
jgi:hypothetical protein